MSGFPWDIAVGSLFVIIHAGHRFVIPATKRSSTTAARYYAAMLAYGAWGLTLYLALALLPEALQSVELIDKMSGVARAAGLPYPLLVSLAVTVLLPHIEPLSTIDRRIRERLEYMAAIPYEARRLSDQLAGSDTVGADASFQVPASMRHRVTRNMREDEFGEEDIVFDAGDRLNRLWTKVVALKLSLEDWKCLRRFSSFYATHGDRLADIDDTYRELNGRVKRCLRFLHTIPEDRGDMAVEYRVELELQVRKLLKRLYECISAAVLQGEIRQDERTQRLVGLGFAFARPLRPSPILMFHRLAILLAGVFPVTLGGFTLNWSLGNISRPYSFVFALAVFVSFTYVIAVFWAVFPREQQWALARPVQPEVRPAVFYLAASILAVATNLLVIVPWVVVKLTLWSDTGNFGSAFRDSSVWLLLTITTTFVTAFLIDGDEGSFPRRYGRISEGAVQSVATACAAAVVLLLLPRGKITSVAILNASFIGFVVGACVPTWFRSAPRARAAVAVAPVEAASRPVTTSGT